MNFFIKTFGCKTNQIESEFLIETLKNEGFFHCEDIEKSEICIINSCTVTESADSKVLHFVNFAKKRNRKLKIFLLGCWSQVHKNEAKNLKNVDVVLGNTNKLELLKYLKKEKVLAVDSIENEKIFKTFLVSKIEKTRATVKIQDGCNSKCSYCIIPFARGKSRSNNKENIIKQINLLCQNGYKEIVLTGIHIGQWGIDFEKKEKFKNLIEDIFDKTQIERVRLGSLTPNELDDDFLKILKQNETRFANHFHISIQSLCNKTLKNMNRFYCANDVLLLIEKIKTLFPFAFVGADIICGFPGETEDDFYETFENIKKSKISQVHAFPYSKRPKTKAYEMPLQVDQKTKNQRVKKVKTLGRSKLQTFLVENLEHNFAEKALFLNKIDKKTGYQQGICGNYINVIAENFYDGLVPISFKYIKDSKIFVEVKK